MGTAPTRFGAFSYPRVGREVRPIYIIRWSGAVGGNAVVVVLHSLMLQGDEVNTKSRDGCCRLRLSGVGANVRRKTSFPPCHRHHPHRHALHDDSIPHGSKKRPVAVKKVRLSPVKKQLLVEGTAPTRSGAFSYPGVGREVRPIYIIRWSVAVGGIAVVVVLHSLMLQGDEVNTKSRDGCCRLRLGGSGANVRRKTSFPPCHCHHPHRHAPHDDSIPHGSKSGLRP